MVQVRHGGEPELTLGLLEEELVVLQCTKHRANVAEVIRPGGVVNQDVIEKYKNKTAQEGVKDNIHERLKCGWRVRDITA